MKNQLLSIIILALLTLTACKQAETAETAQEETTEVEQTNSIDYAALDNKVATMRAFIQAHCDENLEAQRALVADTLRWGPPYYNGNVTLGKEDYMAALKGYHDGYENIKYTEGISINDSISGNGFFAGNVYPEGFSVGTPGVMRAYGLWSATHTESGKEIGVKWFSLFSVNDDNKIAMISEFWDANGLAAQIAEE